MLLVWAKLPGLEKAGKAHGGYIIYKGAYIIYNMYGLMWLREKGPWARRKNEVACGKNSGPPNLN